jgi:hypothetical protein
VGGFKVQVQQTFQPVLAQSCRTDAMEKTENKERFPLSHGTAAAISMNLMKDLLHLEFESNVPHVRTSVRGPKTTGRSPINVLSFLFPR